MRFVLLFVVALAPLVFGQDYIVPEPTFEILHPKGFKVSIPDDGDIKLFAFHGNINREIVNREAGQFSVDISRPQNGRWTFQDKNTRFNVGDVIYYWLYVIHNDGRGYLREDESYTVQEIRKNNGNNGNKNKDKNKNKDTNTARPITIPIPTAAPTTTTTTTTTTTQAPVCEDTLTRVNGATTCSGKLIFTEEFNDLHKWQKEIKFGGEPDYEFVIYINDNQNLYLENGQLHIRPTAAEDKYGLGFVRLPEGLNLGINCTSIVESECKRIPFSYSILPPVLSGRINTKSSFSFLYGKIDIRAKLPKGDWIYPELYLTPKRFAYGLGYDSGEMRIAFVPGNVNLNNALEGGLILGDNKKGRTYAFRKLSTSTPWSDDFHVFSLLWKPDGITLLVDDNIYGNIYPPAGGFSSVFGSESNADAAKRWSQGDVMAPFDKEMVITIGVGVGGHSIPDTDGKPYRNEDAKEMAHFYKAQSQWKVTWQENSELIVDYVKVYAL